MSMPMKTLTVVTWKGGGNFGTCLQSFSLLYKLKSLGYRVYFLEYLPRSFGFKSFIKLLMTKLKIYSFFRNVLKNVNKSPKARKRHAFQNEFYEIPVICSERQKRNFIDTVDVFITGSDQIWNTYFAFNPFFFLDFAQQKKRVAYASSIGTDSIKESCKIPVKQLLQKFDHIGVRESSAVTILSDLTKRNDIVQVVDPTFLINGKQWEKLSERAKVEIKLPDRYLFCYLIGNNESYARQVMDVSRMTNIENIVIVPSEENASFTIKNAIVYNDASPIDFVYLIRHASYVCTDSFHATALSLNLSKQFVELLRFRDDDVQSQNSRIYDMLDHYDLSNRFYKEKSVEWCRDIDYSRVAEALELDRKKSMSFLLDAIEH